MDAQQMAHDLIKHTRTVAAGGSVDGGELARILKLLATYEIEEGGPYAVKEGGTLVDVDFGFNLAIACFLKAHDVQLPKLDAFIQKCLGQRTHTSRVVKEDVLMSLIQRYQATTAPTQKKDTIFGTQYTEDEVHMMARIKLHIKERCAPLSLEMRGSALWVIDRTIRKNPDKQMSLMPYFMRESLGARGTQFTDDHIAALGAANVFFWTAFIVYDDFWDEDEAAEPRLLPTANFFAREYVQLFSALRADPNFPRFFHTIMDKLDAANTWEMYYCRMQSYDSVRVLPDTLPDYGDFDIKFYPAAGHILGPVALFNELGYSLESVEVEQLIEYFKHYLIAMQLNDDAHDWREDLERGHISTAVYLLLQKWREHHPRKKGVDLEKDMAELEQLFWFEVLTPLCTMILERTERSRQALSRLFCVKNREPLEQFIVRSERAAHQALTEQKRSSEFLNAF